MSPSNVRNDSAGRGPLVAVVGAGIVGLAQAWAAARRGCRVVVIERHAWAHGASIRNFGMVWPIGQPAGDPLRTALQSRRLWDEFIAHSGVWADACGSLHLAYRDDERCVLEEFVKAASTHGVRCRLLSAREAAAASPAVRIEGLVAALYSESEMCVDPREVVRRAPAWLAGQYGVEFRFGVKAQHVEGGRVALADGTDLRADMVVVAAGHDLRDLYPELYRQAGFQKCKLQMLRTAPQPSGWRLGPMLAGGLTLRHYAAFSACKSLGPLKQRIAAETPELDAFGIHVMASQNGLNEVVLGDSHEYGDDVSPFDSDEIERLMLRELRKFLTLPSWEIAERWHGVYPKSARHIQFDAEPEPGVRVAVASGGAGMTMSFGFADQYWEDELGPATMAPAAPRSRDRSAARSFG